MANGDQRRDDAREPFWGDDFYSERERRYRGGQGHYGKGPKGWKWSDERVRDAASEALYRDYEVDASDIEITVKEGVVTLTGTVESREQKRLAEESIDNLVGVVDIHNRLRIQDKRVLS